MTAYAPAGDPTAVTGRRIVAYLIDGLLSLLLVLAFVGPQFRDFVREDTWPNADLARLQCERYNGTGSYTRTTAQSGACVNIDTKTYIVTQHDLSQLQGRLWIVGLGFGALNYLLIQGLTGASIGKLLLGLRVIREDGNKAGVGWLALRWLLLPIDAFCCGIVGLLTVANSKGHRRVGDMAASTYVVRKDAVGTPPFGGPGISAAPGAPYGAPGYGAPGYGAPAYPPPGGQPGYGGQPGATPGPTWSAPGAPATPPPAPGAAPSGDGPTWDEARNTYIQYDRNQGAWVQWDDATSTWGPISQ